MLLGFHLFHLPDEPEPREFFNLFTLRPDSGGVFVSSFGGFEGLWGDFEGTTGTNRQRCLY